MVASSNIWMPIYIGDYLADTMHLSTEEHGAYFLAIIHYWRNGGAFPKSQLANIIRTKNEQILNTILSFFEEKNGILYHKRIDSELKKSKKITKERSNAGKKSAESKKNKLQQNFNKTSTKLQQNELPSPSQSPSPLPPQLQTPKEGVLKNFKGEKKYDIDHYLNDTGRAYAKLNAPGWDMYYLINVYNEGIANGMRAPPDSPNAAFPKWCKNYTKGKSQCQ